MTQKQRKQNQLGKAASLALAVIPPTGGGGQGGGQGGGRGGGKARGKGAAGKGKLRSSMGDSMPAYWGPTWATELELDNGRKIHFCDAFHDMGPGLPVRARLPALPSLPPNRGRQVLQGRPQRSRVPRPH